MASFTTFGWDGSLNETDWARFHARQQQIGWYFGVASGMNVTNVAGVRTGSVSAGTALLPGVYVDSGAADPISHTVNNGTTPRTDLVVLRGTWANNTVLVAVREGSGTTAPSPTQTFGGTWEMPLARGVVGTGTGGAVVYTSAKPIPRGSYAFEGSAIVDATMQSTSAGRVVSTISLPDPGWPYYLRVNSSVRVSAEIGYVFSEFEVDGVMALTGASDSLQVTGLGRGFTRIHQNTPPMTGAHALGLRLTPVLVAAGTLTNIHQHRANYFQVEQVPIPG